jgi:hypothetical protein
LNEALIPQNCCSSLDLGAGQGHRDQAVAERLDGERLLVGDVAVALRPARREQQLGADAARVHERRHGAAQLGREQGLAPALGHDVGRQELEVGAGEVVAVEAAVDRVAAAVLHAEALGPSSAATGPVVAVTPRARPRPAAARPRSRRGRE